MARSSHTNAELLAARLDVPLSDTFDLAVELCLEGHELGGRLTLETLLVATSPKPLGPLAPQHPGSILWRRTHWSDLEGAGAQFPTDTIDFSSTGRTLVRDGSCVSSWRIQVRASCLVRG